MRNCIHWLCASCSLYSVHDEEKPFELEVAWICDASDREFRRVPADIVEAAEQQAKASLEESDMCVLTPLSLYLAAFSVGMYLLNPFLRRQFSNLTTAGVWLSQTVY